MRGAVGGLCTVSAPLAACSPVAALPPAARLLALHVPLPHHHTLYFVVQAKSRVRELYRQTCRHFQQQGMLDTDLFGLAIICGKLRLPATPSTCFDVGERIDKLDGRTRRIGTIGGRGRIPRWRDLRRPVVPLSGVPLSVDGRHLVASHTHTHTHTYVSRARSIKNYDGLRQKNAIETTNKKKMRSEEERETHRTPNISTGWTYIRSLILIYC